MVDGSSKPRNENYQFKTNLKLFIVLVKVKLTDENRANNNDNNAV